MFSPTQFCPVAEHTICQNQEVPSSGFFPPSPGVSKRYQEYDRAPAPEATVQDARPVSDLEPSTNSQVFSGCYDWSGINDGTAGGNDEDYNSWTVTDLCGEEPFFCRAGNCHCRRMALRQVKRHWDVHLGDHYGFTYPNQATCPSRRAGFMRTAKGPQCVTISVRRRV